MTTNETSSATQGWGSQQLQFWENEIEEFMKLKHLEKFKPPSDARTQRPEIQPETQDQNSTAKIAFKRAEKPSRFLVEEGRYEAICVTVHDPHWDKRWRKWQVRFEFELCGMTTPPLTQFVNCGKDEAAPVIDGWLLQTMNAVGAESPCELRCRDFYVYAKTVVCDRKGRALPRHEWYSVVSRSSLITSEQDLVEAEADDEAACA